MRGGAVVYLSITGLVFTFLLSGTDVDTAIPWVNTVVHELMPLVFVADWLIDPPAQRLTMRQGSVWLIFPFAWITYTLIRGSITELYPYPFLNPDNGGYASVVAYSVGILALMLIVSAVVVWLGNMRKDEPDPPHETSLRRDTRLIRTAQGRITTDVPIGTSVSSFI